MPFRLELRFPTAAQLEEHLSRYQERGGVMIPERLCPDLQVPGPPDGVELHFVVGTQRAVARGQAQRRGRMGVMVEMRQEALQDAWRLVARGGGRRQRTPQEVEGGRPIPLGRLAGVRRETPLGGVEERVRTGPEPEKDKEKLWERYMSIDSQDLPPASITPVDEAPMVLKGRGQRDRGPAREGQGKAQVGELHVKPVSLWEQETEVREQRPPVEVGTGLGPVELVAAGPAVAPVELEQGPAIEPMEVVELSLEDVVPPARAAEGSDPGAGAGQGGAGAEGGADGPHSASLRAAQERGGGLAEVAASGQTPVDAPEEGTPSHLRRRIRQGELQLGGLIWLDELGGGAIDVDALPVPQAEAVLPDRTASVTSADTALNLEEAAAALAAVAVEAEGELQTEGEEQIPGPIFELTLEAMIAASSEPVPEGSAATMAGEPSVVRREGVLEAAAVAQPRVAVDRAAVATLAQLAAGPQSPIGEPQQPFAEPQPPIGQPKQLIGMPQSPIGELQQPFAEPQSPIGEPQSPIGQPKQLIAEPQSPIAEPQPPIGQPKQLIGMPQSPIGELQQPFAEPQSPIGEPQSPIVEPQPPIAEPQSPIGQPQQPIAEPQQPIAEPQSPIAEPQSPIVEPQPPTLESAPMAESPPASPDLSALDLLRLACQPERQRDQGSVLQLIHHPRAGRALRVRLLSRLDHDGLLAVAQTPDLPSYLHEAAVQRLSRLALPIDLAT